MNTSSNRTAESEPQTHIAGRETYRVTIGGVQRDLPLCSLPTGERIAVFNLLGDTAVVKEAGQALARLLVPMNADVLVTPEAKSVPLAYEIASIMEMSWVVLRKTYKPYMGSAIAAETLSITTGQPQNLYLDEKDTERVTGKRVILFDDVISTGSTLDAMRRLMATANAEVVAEAAVFTEGDSAPNNVVALGHLPIQRATDLS